MLLKCRLCAARLAHTAAMSDWWGTAPAWVSAIGTSGSLLMGFTILMRDRRKDERADAQKVVVFRDRVEAGEARVSVRNMADRPIIQVALLTLRSADEPNSAAEAAFYEWEIEAGGSRSYQVQWPVDRARLLFHDADGIWWARDLKSSQVRKVGRRGVDGTSFAPGRVVWSHGWREGLRTVRLGAVARWVRRGTRA